jgi:hypothetical protein
MSENCGIEIGMNIVPTIYLHVENFDMESQFDVRKIGEIYPLNGESENGCIVAYVEDPSCSRHYYVQESAEQVKEAMKMAKKYRDVCLKALDKYLERKAKKNAPE